MLKRFHGSRKRFACRNEDCEINRYGGEKHTCNPHAEKQEPRKPSPIVASQPQIYKCGNCGTVVSTACKEYFCPTCHKVIVQPEGRRK